MTKMQDFQKKAQRRFRRLQKQWRDPRYLNVIGRLVHEGLLHGSGVLPTRSRMTVDDVLWVGEVEPRVYELLPAILFRRPRMFVQARPLPDDLAQVLSELRRGNAKTTFRGVPPEKYAHWLIHVGRNKTSRPAVIKSHRFTEEDLSSIEELKQRWSVDATEVLRRALKLALEVE